jgi:hypothetical protein
MGVLNYLFDNEWIQRHDIDATRRAVAAQAIARAGAARRLEDRMDAIEDEVGQLALFVRTLFRLSVEKGSISKAEFLETARAIDAQDGKADGRYTGPLSAP